MLFTSWLFINKWQTCPIKKAWAFQKTTGGFHYWEVRCEGFSVRLQRLWKLLPSLLPVSHGRRLPLTTQQMKTQGKWQGGKPASSQENQFAAGGLETGVPHIKSSSSCLQGGDNLPHPALLIISLSNKFWAACSTKNRLLSVVFLLIYKKNRAI